MPAAPNPGISAIETREITTLLLDVGGVFLLPAHDSVTGVFERVEVPFDAERLDRAHYAGASAFPGDYEGELAWPDLWRAYLVAFTAECGVPADRRDEAIDHLGSEFASDGLWTRVAPGAVDALRAIDATGVQIGIVSNAGGNIAAQLRELEVLQVGPGMGVEVGTIIDSGAVGVEKPDPRIFTLALDALAADPAHTAYVGDMPPIDVVGARRAGLRPLLMDPYGFQDGVDCERLTSLADVLPLLS